MTNRRNSNPVTVYAAALVALFMLAMFGVALVSATHTADYRGCTVTDKDRAGSRSGSSSDMRVYTSCGVFQVSDSLLSRRWDASDVYATVEVGNTYDIHARGYRIPFLSRFPNLLTADPTGMPS